MGQEDHEKDEDSDGELDYNDHKLDFILLWCIQTYHTASDAEYLLVAKCCPRMILSR